MMPEPESELERALSNFRRELLRRERAAASAMVRVYGEAWEQIQTRLADLDAEYQSMKALGAQPGPEWIYEYNRARSFRDQVEGELNRFAQYAENQVREQQRAAIEAAEQQAEALTRRALGRMPAGMVIDWNRIDRSAVETMVGLTQPDSPLHRLLLSISNEGAEAAERALVQGLLMGFNPRKVAPMLRRVLGVSLSRALTISRTETLRAHREATRASYQANGDLLQGWIWHSAADERTCAACWAMHGTEHKLEEILDDHPNGRCAMVPKTATWGEIGERFGVDLRGVSETRSEIEPGVSLFAKLPADKQIRILGPAKWAAWKDKQFELPDLVGRKRDRVWGSMRYERSLKDVVGEEAAKGYMRTLTTRTPVILSVISPGGTPVSDALNVLPGYAQKNIIEALKIIDAIHGDGNLPIIPAKSGGVPRGASAAFVHSIFNTPVEIRVGKKSGMFSIAHELGHFIDFSGMGTQNSFSSISDKNGLLKEWWDAIINSKRYQELVKMHNTGTLEFADGTTTTRGTAYLSYLLRDQELWARSYSQYIATKSKNSAMLKEMTEEFGEKSQFNVQWNDDDFVSISGAIDNLFSNLGWIK